MHRASNSCAGTSHHLGTLFPLISQFCTELLEGIAAYCQSRPGWELHIEKELVSAASLARLRAKWPRTGKCGLLVQIWEPPQLRPLKESGLPIVEIGASLRRASFPRVSTDDEAIGKLAAQHLLEKGFRHLGFWGPAGGRHATERCRAFKEAGEQAGAAMRFQGVPMGERDPRLERRRLRQYLKQCPKPVGVFCVNDAWAFDLVKTALGEGYRVPEDIAVLGTGNDLLGRIAPVPISTIDLGGYRIGFEAAALLGRCSGGLAKPIEAISVPPARLIVRRSTETLAVQDEWLGAALQWLKQHAAEPVGVADLLAAIPVSRRTLETRFRRLLGRGLERQLYVERVALAKRLLRENDIAIKAVARNCGFASPASFCTIFTRQCGMSPAVFRRYYAAKD